MKQKDPSILDEHKQNKTHTNQEEFLTGLLKIHHPQNFISHFFQEMGKIHPNLKGLFVKYLSFRHLLLVTHEYGLTQKKGEGLSLPPPQNEQDLNMLENPLQLREIKTFLTQILKSSSLIVCPIKILKQVKGFFIFENSSLSQSFRFQKEKEEEMEYKKHFSEFIKPLSLVWENRELSLKLHDSKYVPHLPFVLKKDFLFESLEKEFSRSRRIGQPVSLILISMDDFFKCRKKNNWAVAKWREKKLTKFLAFLLKEQTRSYDHIIQLSHHEFALILPHTNQINAARVAERLRLSLETTNFSSFLSLEKSEENLSFTLSQGVAEYPSHCQNPEEALKKADEALYQVKTNGKNKVCLVMSSDEHFKANPNGDFNPLSLKEKQNG